MSELFPPETLKRRPPLRYHGSKWNIAPWLISQFPPHKCYVEVFGGGAAVLLRKERATTEVYNDLEDSVVDFFRILRTDGERERLIRAVDLTPFSRAEFKRSYQPTDDPIESARRFVVRSFMAHGTCSSDVRDSNGFRSRDHKARKSYAREWAGVPLAIQAAADRMTGVTIENLDWRRLIQAYDDKDTFFYLDPPYPLSTRSSGGKGYVWEMSDGEHRQLAWLAHQATAKIAISGYDCGLYQELYGDWSRQEKATRACGQKGSVKRTECLWTNYEVATNQPIAI